MQTFTLTQLELQELADTVADCPRYRQVSKTMSMIRNLKPNKTEVQLSQEVANKPTSQPKKRINSKDNAKK